MQELAIILKCNPINYKIFLTSLQQSCFNSWFLCPKALFQGWKLDAIATYHYCTLCSLSPVT